MAIARDELATTAHRLSNYLECRLSELLPQLVIEERHEAVTDLAFAGCRLVRVLREIRDGKEGDE